MSELINTNDNRATIRWKLLTGASALALTAYVSSAALARAEDTDHPLLWIELGGQMELVQGTSRTFTAPFMFTMPDAGPYQNGGSPTENQRAPRYALGVDGKISFEPEGSDWVFSAGIRYGRSHGDQHTHKQTAHPSVPWQFTLFGYTYHYEKYFPTRALSDTKARHDERHLILDFTAGKDVGLGLFGQNGSSTVNAGVRFASFTANSSVDISARPVINSHVVTFSIYSGYIQAPVPLPSYHQYNMLAHARRSFRGIGPSLSWNASAALAGNTQDGELTLDWGINAALLFGKQKAKTDHTTQAYHFTDNYVTSIHALSYRSPHHSTRSRSVTVPNVGGFAGISVKYPNVKFSVGYRIDTFLGAMDTGIDVRKSSNTIFHGPYASISIGLGD